MVEIKLFIITARSLLNYFDIDIHYFFCNSLVISMILASLKNLGAKTTSLFERKKKDVEQLAQEKAAEVQKLAEDQAKLAADSLTKAKADVEQLASSTGIKTILRILFTQKVFELKYSESE